jgi:ubiquinone/menaquinone biosynthesis C-methylase UbiE
MGAGRDAHTDGSGWRRAYRDAPQVLHEFAAAEDPDGLVRLAIADLAPESAEERCVKWLELGCGTICLGATIPGMNPANWIGLDSAPAVLQSAQKHASDSFAAQVDSQSIQPPKLVCARAEQIPLHDHAVDVILATWMLAYLSPVPLRQCLEECDRVLKPDGAILAVENGAHADGMPADGNVDRLLAHGFQEVAEVQTELRFENADRARAVTRFLMGDLAPTPGARGCIPHRVKLLRRSRR